MDAEQAAENVRETARREVRRVCSMPMTLIKTGEAPKFMNPFTARMESVRVDPSMVKVAESLRQAGLDQNEEFMAAMATFMNSLAGDPIFSLLSAIDGEGGFAKEMSVSLKLRDGTEISGGLHEGFYPIE